MLLSLGVSRPILNYVIFCHQEDSNWPLEEGSKVKDKFDEIFNSAKYQKCLKNIKDVRKEELDQAKIHKKDMEHYKSDKEYADNKARDLTSKREDLERIQDSVTRLADELAPLIEELNQLSEEEKGFADVQKKLAEAQTGYGHVKKERELLEEQITEILDDSMDEVEIEEKRDGVLRETKKKEKEIQEQKVAVVGHEDQISEAEVGIQKNAANLGKAIAELNQHNKNLKELDELIEKTAEKFGLNAEDDGSFVSVLEREEKKIASKIVNMRAKNKENEGKIEDEIDRLKSSKTSLEELKKREQSDMMTQKKEVAIIKRQLSELEGAAEKLEKIKSDWEEAGVRLEREKSKYDLKSLAEEAEREKQTVKDLDCKERKVRDELRSLDEKQGIYQRISHYDQDIEKKQVKVEKIIQKRQNDFLQLFETVPDNKRLKNRFKDSEDSTEKQMREIETKKATLEAESKSKKNQRKESNKSLDKSLSRIKVLEEKIGDVLGSDEVLEDEIAKVKENLERARKDLALREAKKFTYREMIERMETMTGHACPLCLRKFNTKKEADELIEELEDEIILIPKKAKSLEGKVRSLTEKQELLQKVSPEVHELKNLKAENDSQLKKIEEIDKEIKNLKKEIEDIDEDKNLVEVNVSLLKQVCEDVQQVDSLTRELANLREERQELSLELDTSGPARGIEEVRAEEEEVTTKLRVARQNLEKCQEVHSSQTSLINDLQSKRNNLTQKKLDIEGQQQQRANMMEKKEELEKKVKISESEVKRCTRELEPILEQLEETETKKRKVVVEGEKDVDKLIHHQKDLEMSSSNLKTLEKNIERYLESGQEEKREKLKKEKVTLNRAIDELKKQKKTSEERISKLMVEISNQENRKRMFNDNLRLREFRTKEEQYRKNITAKEKELENTNWKSVEEKKARLSGRYHKVSGEKSTKEGQREEMSKVIKELEREMNNPKWRNAASKFKEVAVRHKLSVKAAADLDKYYR